MKTPYSIRLTEIVVYLHALILGFLIGELWYFGQSIGLALTAHIQTPIEQYVAVIICGFTVIIAIAYFYVRDGVSQIPRLWKSKRIDLLVLLILGIYISTIVGGVGTIKYKEYISKIELPQLVLLSAIPIIISLMLVIKTALNKIKKDVAPFFLNDQAIKYKEYDLLAMNESASRFAERVINNGSLDSLIFGIDAPWGIGKSSFINLCCDYWKRHSTPKPIVHRFEPLRYTSSADLIVKFVHEMISTIQKEVFFPSVSSLLSKYLLLIGKSEFSFLGFKFDIAQNFGTADDILKALENQLLALDRKIIIIVDDLDRLTWTEVKNILFAIKRSFVLPNVSYVLCYDTDNLTALTETHHDAEIVQEFLEKFVNVKIGIYLDSEVLAEYVSTNIESAIQKNLQLNPHLLDQIRQALSALVGIYTSDEFVHYQGFLGDLRKLKRLINTMMLFDIEKTDFKNSDYDKNDLIHLLLIYINYPHIFRKIYNTETGGKSGFFSVKYDYGHSQGANSPYKNSEDYEKYIRSINENQKFLLNKIFNVEALFSNEEFGVSSDNIQPAAIRIRACFNDPFTSDRNLERYLNLIVKLSKQKRLDAYSFYVSKKNDLINGEAIEEIFLGEDFNFSNGEFAREQLWHIISNSTSEISPEMGTILVLYILNTLPEYSFIEAEYVGAAARTSLIYSLLKILNHSAWGGSIIGRRNNNEENITEIADWVFGDNIHSGEGILAALSEPDRGILGIFDLLLFRLYCSADRGSSLFNLQRAIALHGNPLAPTGGLTTEIAKEGMREISQVVFKIFSEQYIEPKINLFSMVDELSFDDFVGESANYIRTQISKRKISQEQIDELVEREKTHVIVFIIYQLGNNFISSGVGCGYYDETGNNDRQGIAARMNEYLFDMCFNPSLDAKGYEWFLDYLLMNFSHNFGIDDFIYRPNIDEFTKVLDKKRLQEYWKQHKQEILKLKLEEKDKCIITANYSATYKERLADVYRALDAIG